MDETYDMKIHDANVICAKFWLLCDNQLKKKNHFIRASVVQLIVGAIVDRVRAKPFYCQRLWSDVVVTFYLNNWAHALNIQAHTFISKNQSLQQI